MLHIVTWTEKEKGKRAVERCYKLTSTPFEFAPKIAHHGGFKIEPVNDDQLQGITKLATDGEYYLTIGKSMFNATFAKMLNLATVPNSIKVTASDEQRVDFADAIGLDATGILREIKGRIVSKKLAELQESQSYLQGKLQDVEQEIDACMLALADLDIETAVA